MTPEGFQAQHTVFFSPPTYVTHSFLFVPSFPTFILDPLQKPPVKELLTTLDGKHWALDDTKRTTRRSQPPASTASLAGSRAPSKTRGPSPVIGPGSHSRVLFVTEDSPSPSATGDDPDYASPLVDGGSTVVVRSRPPSPPDHSFLEDFIPRGISGSYFVAGSSSVLQTTASALNSTATAVLQMFGPASDRPAGSRPTMDARADAPDDTPRARRAGDAAPPLPTPQQFAELQLRYAALQRRVDELASRQSAEQRARAIDDEIELRRKTAYEAANLPYSPRLNVPGSPLANPSPLGPRSVEYRVSHKSIGFLRPADPSLKPFEAVDGDVYVRPLAWLAHLRTKLELKEDFNYKNQVLQVASECLVGRAAAWWTAIGQRMRNMLLTDYTLDLWHQHMQVLCQSKEQTRKEALERSWRTEREECWDYVWDKSCFV